MEFKHAASLLLSNIQYIFKLFLYMLICLLIVAAVATAVIVPIGEVYMEYGSVSSAVNLLKDAVNSYIAGSVGLRGVYAAAYESVTSFFVAAAAFPGLMSACVLLPVLFYFLYSFLIGLSYYAMSDIVNGIMSSNLKMGLLSDIALNFKHAVKFSAAKMLIAFPIDVVICAVLVGLCIGLYQVVGVLAFTLVLILAVALLSLRSLLFSGWLPRILHHPEERIFDSFIKSMPAVKRNMKSLFLSFCITYFIAYCLGAALALPTYGIILVFVPSTYYFILRAIELVGYYKLKGFRFYTDASTVVDTTEFGYRPETQDINLQKEKEERIIAEINASANENASCDQRAKTLDATGADVAPDDAKADAKINSKVGDNAKVGKDADNADNAAEADNADSAVNAEDTEIKR